MNEDRLKNKKAGTMDDTVEYYGIKEGKEALNIAREKNKCTTNNHRLLNHQK